MPGITLILAIILGLIIYKLINLSTRKSKWKTPKVKFPDQWRHMLDEHVLYYAALNSSEKFMFEAKVHEFMLNVKIIGIKIPIADLDRVLVASSAVIPIFSFPEWKYTNLQEVLLYADTFNRNFETKGPNRNILGMVGYGFMEGKMCLSKKALHDGFSNSSDKRNTAIHEFIHLIDKMDGNIDGVPEVLIENPSAIPWLDLIRIKIDEIYAKSSDINPYGGTNKAEFFAVVGEYFFERPRLLAKRHPKLYEVLESIFKQDMISMDLAKQKKDLERNAPCWCGSGKKFKKCHLK